MFKIEDDLIKVTRGDYGEISIITEDEFGIDYTFQVGDVVRFSVYEKGNMSDIKLRKEIEVEEETKEVQLILTSTDTKIGEIINKPKDYWYELELNPDGEAKTILGYDDEGAKILRLYPEGDDSDVEN